MWDTMARWAGAEYDEMQKLIRHPPQQEDISREDDERTDRPFSEET